MAKNTPGGLLRHIRQLADGEASDGELLRRFANRQDQAAFALLVRRHGAMVFGVCRRVLGNAADADDAFQAVFLILVRKAATLDGRGTVGNWLYTVAYRVALRARANAARRSQQEKQTMRPPGTIAEDDGRELRQILDEELTRLPEKYRAPIVLCYLEGKTNDEAARQLGWTKGTVSGRLARARALLQSRLAGRQLLFSATALGAVATENELPAELARETVRNAVLFTSGKTIAAPIAALVEGGMRVMALSKWKMAAVILAGCTILAGSGLAAVRALANPIVAPAEAVSIDAVSPAEPADRPFVLQVALASARDQPEFAAPTPLDQENRIKLLFSDEVQRFGISILRLRDPRYPEKPKLLTRNERGNTNNTRLFIDGYKYTWGRQAPGAGVRWAEIDGEEMKGLHEKGSRKWTSIMDFGKEGIRATQRVEIVVGPQTRLYDTALVTYIVENRDEKPHTVGLRVMLDTYIGLNDGVPFLIPPTDGEAGYLLDTKGEFERGKIPEFVQALEGIDLADKEATVAQFGLKIKGAEPLDKLVICRWPQEFGAGEADWNWPLQAMNEPAGAPKDSCVALYWSKVRMKPGEKRTLAFTYGLGPTADTAAGDKAAIRVMAGGASRVGRPMTVIGYIKGAKKRQKATLLLPAGLKLAAGQKEEQPVTAAEPNELGIVSWQIEPAHAGKFEVKVVSDNKTAKQVVYVWKDSLYD